MQFNHYDAYSALSEMQKKDFDKWMLISNQANHLLELDDITTVQEYIKSAWNISEPIKNYALADDCIITILDSEKSYCVKLVCKNTNIIYNYTK